MATLGEVYVPTKAPRPIGVGPLLEPATFDAIRRTMALEHCKWDAQVGDETTLAAFPLLITGATWHELAEASERLASELLACERELLARPELHPRIALPRPLSALLRGGGPSLTPAAGRVMRFDFHWTTEGWRVSEVNSDVPGGYTEAENFSGLVAERTPGARLAGAPARALVDALERVAERGVVALLSAAGYLEDHQVIAHLARRLRERGLEAHLVSPHHLRWKGGRAELATSWYAGPVDAIVRFYQAEWLAAQRGATPWQQLVSGALTPVVNPGVAAIGESKRLPLIWGELDTPVPTWRRFTPETREPGAVRWREKDAWVFKRAYSNCGDTVFMPPAMTTGARAKLAWNLRLRPGAWVAQRRFHVVPIDCPLGPVYPCLGVYTVDGRAAGLYGRIARGPVVNYTAIDVAILVCEQLP